MSCVSALFNAQTPDDPMAESLAAAGRLERTLLLRALRTIAAALRVWMRASLGAPSASVGSALKLARLRWRVVATLRSIPVPGLRAYLGG